MKNGLGAESRKLTRGNIFTEKAKILSVVKNLKKNI
jgi:hypothetical protein